MCFSMCIKFIVYSQKQVRLVPIYYSSANYKLKIVQLGVSDSPFPIHESSGLVEL